MIGGNNDRFFNRGGGLSGRIRRNLACIAIFAGFVATSCGSASTFIKTDIERQDGITGMLAYCWRVQKDNSASGGGNTRNCDGLEAEYLRQQKVLQCRASGQKPDTCFNRFYGVN